MQYVVPPSSTCRTFAFRRVRARGGVAEWEVLVATERDDARVAHRRGDGELPAGAAPARNVVNLTEMWAHPYRGRAGIKPVFLYKPSTYKRAPPYAGNCGLSHTCLCAEKLPP